MKRVFFCKLIDLMAMEIAPKGAGPMFEVTKVYAGYTLGDNQPMSSIRITTTTTTPMPPKRQPGPHHYIIRMESLED